MKRILFVCLGNICRSPMAEFVMKKLVRDAGLEGEFEIASAGTSGEEAGSDMHPGARAKLAAEGVPFSPRRARQIAAVDYDRYDLLIGMDIKNLLGMERLWRKDPAGKVKLLLSYAGKDRDIADPWYTHDFDKTYGDILEGCTALLASVR
ncbi:MAG: low molecular weight phosphotyrosine protein phosphatase [Treponemataceae bacterium]|nr:low molecular weight phosphotyrosine protein phosphatase [Treponemataceae bacterium]